MLKARSFGLGTRDFGDEGVWGQGDLGRRDLNSALLWIMPSAASQKLNSTVCLNLHFTNIGYGTGHVGQAPQDRGCPSWLPGLNGSSQTATCPGADGPGQLQRIRLLTGQLPCLITCYRTIALGHYVSTIVQPTWDVHQQRYPGLWRHSLGTAFDLCLGKCSPQLWCNMSCQAQPTYKVKYQDRKAGAHQPFPSQPFYRIHSYYLWPRQRKSFMMGPKHE